MNPLQDHALAGVQHAERYRHGPAPRIALSGARARVGQLLVGAGLHLMTRGDRRGPARIR